MFKRIRHSLYRRYHRTFEYPWWKLTVSVASILYIWDQISSSLFAFLATII